MGGGVVGRLHTCLCVVNVVLMVKAATTYSMDCGFGKTDVSCAGAGAVRLTSFPVQDSCI